MAALWLVEIEPDVLVCDGFGIANPRRFGLAYNAVSLAEACEPVPPRRTAGCAKGRNSHVSTVPDEKSLRSHFERWTSGAERLPARGSKIPDVYRLPDGTVIQWRTASKSGGATIDIVRPDGPEGLKVHVEGQ